VRDLTGPPQQPAAVEVGRERGVGGLEEDAADQRHRLHEPALGVDRVDQWQAVLAADLAVLRAVRRRDVDQARAVLGRDVGRRDDVVRLTVDVDQLNGRR
jgi:hypothetical protein